MHVLKLQAALSLPQPINTGFFAQSSLQPCLCQKSMTGPTQPEMLQSACFLVGPLVISGKIKPSHMGIFGESAQESCLGISVGQLLLPFCSLKRKPNETMNRVASLLTVQAQEVHLMYFFKPMAKSSSFSIQL